MTFITDANIIPWPLFLCIPCIGDQSMRVATKAPDSSIATEPDVELRRIKTVEAFFHKSKPLAMRQPHSFG